MYTTRVYNAQLQFQTKILRKESVLLYTVQRWKVTSYDKKWEK